MIAALWSGHDDKPPVSINVETSCKFVKFDNFVKHCVDGSRSHAAQRPKPSPPRHLAKAELASKIERALLRDFSTSWIMPVDTIVRESTRSADAVQIRSGSQALQIGAIGEAAARFLSVVSTRMLASARASIARIAVGLLAPINSRSDDAAIARTVSLPRRIEASKERQRSLAISLGTKSLLAVSVSQEIVLSASALTDCRRRPGAVFRSMMWLRAADVGI
jgi:hypothetical protein